MDALEKVQMLIRMETLGTEWTCSIEGDTLALLEALTILQDVREERKEIYKRPEWKRSLLRIAK